MYLLFNLRKKAIMNAFQAESMLKISVFCLILLVGSSSNIYCQSNSETNNTVLQLLSGPNNPRNSEGDFITLKDGRILFVYSHYTGTSGDDHGNAFLAGRYSSDKGKTWTQ